VVSASEMTYIVSGGALNSTNSTQLAYCGLYMVSAVACIGQIVTVVMSCNVFLCYRLAKEVNYYHISPKNHTKSYQSLPSRSDFFVKLKYELITNTLRW